MKNKLGMLETENKDLQRTVNYYRKNRMLDFGKKKKEIVLKKKFTPIKSSYALDKSFQLSRAYANKMEIKKFTFKDFK